LGDHLNSWIPEVDGKKKEGLAAPRITEGPIIPEKWIVWRDNGNLLVRRENFLKEGTSSEINTRRSGTIYPETWETIEKKRKVQV